MLVEPKITQTELVTACDHSGKQTQVQYAFYYLNRKYISYENDEK